MAKLVDKEQKKQLIINAAMSVFVSKGIQATTMTDIAKAANIGKGTIYEYFASREDILVEAFTGFDSLANELITKAVLKAKTPEKKLFAVIDELATMLNEFDMGIMRVSFEFWVEGLKANMQGPFKKMDPTCEFDRNKDNIKAIIDEGIKLGDFKKINSDHTARLIMSVLDGSIYQSIMLNTRANLKKQLRNSLEILLNGIKK